jgi:hypothetical protein
LASLLNLTRNLITKIQEVIMFRFKSKKMTLALSVCVMSMLLSPALTYAEATGTGSTAARQAADQKAALAKKAADRQKAEEEKQKAAKTQETEALGVEAPKQ